MMKPRNCPNKKMRLGSLDTKTRRPVHYRATESQ